MSFLSRCNYENIHKKFFLYACIWTNTKIATLNQSIKDLGFKHLTIEVDGGIDENNIPRLFRCGETSYVFGTKGLFRQEANYCDRIKIIKDCIQKKDDKLEKNDTVDALVKRTVGLILC